MASSFLRVQALRQRWRPRRMLQCSPSLISPKNVPYQKDDPETRRHEHQRRGNGSRGETTDTADTRTTGSSTAQPRSKANQPAGKKDHRNGSTCVGVERGWK